MTTLIVTTRPQVTVLCQKWNDEIYHSLVMTTHDVQTTLISQTENEAHDNDSQRTANRW